MGGVCSSPNDVQFRRASRPMRLTVLASRICCSCEQCAKVPPKISLISVCEMSTDRNCLQCSHAAGPIQLKSAGKNNDSIPASKKQPSGMERYRLVGSYSVLSKLSCCKELHFSRLAEIAPVAPADLLSCFGPQAVLRSSTLQTPRVQSICTLGL